MWLCWKRRRNTFIIINKLDNRFGDGCCSAVIALSLLLMIRELSPLYTGVDNLEHVRWLFDFPLKATA